MKWILFTGTWRLVNAEIEHDVREEARRVCVRGDGLVTGGATGVDYFAMDEWVKNDPNCNRIKIFIPAQLDHYIEDYRKNWKHTPITDADIDALERLLRMIKEKNSSAIIEAQKSSGDITQDDYDLRHDDEVAVSDEVYAFRVNKSYGTGDTIEKATKAGLQISVYKSYTIEE